MTLTLRLIYVKTPKTAGTSVLHALRQYFPDLVHIAARHRHWPSASTLNSARCIVLGEAVLQPFIRRHPSIWHGSYSFAVVRNPYTKAISSWKYLPKLSNYSLKTALTRKRPRKPFLRYYDDQYVLHNHDFIHLCEPQSRWLVGFRDNILVNQLLHFEHLDSCWSNLSFQLSLELPSLEALNIQNYSHLSISPSDLRIVRRLFSRDFSVFGYPRQPPLSVLALLDQKCCPNPFANPFPPY